MRLSTVLCCFGCVRIYLFARQPTSNKRLEGQTNHFGSGGWRIFSPSVCGSSWHISFHNIVGTCNRPPRFRRRFPIPTHRPSSPSCPSSYLRGVVQTHRILFANLQHVRTSCAAFFHSFQRTPRNRITLPNPARYSSSCQTKRGRTGALYRILSFFAE